MLFEDALHIPIPRYLHLPILTYYRAIQQLIPLTRPPVPSRLTSLASRARWRLPPAHAAAHGPGRPFSLAQPSPPPVTISSRSPPAAAFASSSSAPSAPPLPARWSLTNRLFGLNLRPVYASHSLPRQPASRLWAPVNITPRPPPSAPSDPNVPFPRQPPPDDRDEFPLLDLDHRAPESLLVQRSTAADHPSSRTSIALPRTHRSPTPMAAAALHDSVPADARDGAPQLADVESARVGKPASGRVSLPNSNRNSLSRAPSAHEDVDGDDASEFAWGPSHPCFPHPNPHVPLQSALYESTRIIRVKRDWMIKGDLAPTYANLYPEILDPLVNEDDFRAIVKKINDSLVAAFDPYSFRACLDAIMGVATFWLWDDAGLTGVKRQLAELERWIDDWNQNVGAKEAVKIIPLRRTGYLTLDIQIPDPHLGPDTGTTRPTTTENEDAFGHPIARKNDDYGHYPLAPTLQVNSLPPAIESQS